MGLFRDCLALLALAALPSLAGPPPDKPTGDEVCLSCHEKTLAANPESHHHAETGNPKAIRSFKSQSAAAVCMGYSAPTSSRPPRRRCFSSTAMPTAYGSSTSRKCSA